MHDPACESRTRSKTWGPRGKETGTLSPSGGKAPDGDFFLRSGPGTVKLENLLALEERFRRKLAQAATSIGLDQLIVPGAVLPEHVFADDRKQIEALLRGGDSSIFDRGGESVHVHSGEEYRPEPRTEIEYWGDRIRNLAWGVGSGFVGATWTGDVFCARVFDRMFMWFVRYGSDSMIERDTLTSLGTRSCAEQPERMLPDTFVERALDA